MAWFGTSQSVPPGVTVWLGKKAANASEGSVQSKTGNISLVQQRTSIDGHHIVCSLAKEVELYEKHSEPQIKGQSLLKMLEMRNGVAKNHRKNISGSFERKPQVYEVRKFSLKEEKDFQENDNF